MVEQNFFFSLWSSVFLIKHVAQLKRLSDRELNELMTVIASVFDRADSVRSNWIRA
jgi:hypothetical protein